MAANKTGFRPHGVFDDMPVKPRTHSTPILGKHAMTDFPKRTEAVANHLLGQINDLIQTMPDPKDDRVPIVMVALSVAVAAFLVSASTEEGLNEVTSDFVHNLATCIQSGIRKEPMQ